jgi:NTE family protein
MDIALALGGGGSRGFAHIGVLRQLEANRIQVKAIAGTSAGGIIACLYAAGLTPNEMESRFSNIDQKKLYSFFSVHGPGLMGLNTAEKILQDILGERKFSDLIIPCAVVAVDISSGREVILNKGVLVDAIMATIAVPGVFPPRNYGALTLVDGGVLNPVPVAVARQLAPKLPIAAVVLSKLLDKPFRFSKIPLPVEIPQPIVDRITKLRVSQALQIFLQSVDIGQRMIAQLRLEADDPDVIIRPEVDDIGLLDSVDIQRIIMLGEQATKDSLPALKRSMTLTRWMKRSFLRVQ